MKKDSCISNRYLKSEGNFRKNVRRGVPLYRFKDLHEYGCNKLAICAVLWTFGYVSRKK